MRIQVAVIKSLNWKARKKAATGPNSSRLFMGDPFSLRGAVFGRHNSRSAEALPPVSPVLRRRLMAQFFSVHPENPQLRLMKQAVDIIARGGVVAYPTDSAYAL